jgi:tripartite-type tricarboxylate transporter receptor subunit TctC
MTRRQPGNPFALSDALRLGRTASVFETTPRRRLGRLALRWALLAATLAVTAGAQAQGRAQREAADFPTKPLRFVVPSTPGGGADILARAIGPKMAEGLGKPVVIENRAGAGGIIGYEIVAQAPPDGYTLLIVAGGYTLNPSLYAKLPFDTVRDFERVSQIACAPNLLVVHGSVPVKSVQELIAFAKAKPKFLNYASSGVGTTSFLSGEIFKLMTGTDMLHVPYKGAGASTASTIAGETHLIFSSPSALMPHAKTGRVRALGVTSARRLPVIREVPTIAESGLPGFEVNNCYGIVVPAKTPRVIVGKLNAEIVRVLRVPEQRAYLETNGYDVVGSTPEQFDAFTRTDIAKWARELKAAGIQPQ